LVDTSHVTSFHQSECLHFIVEKILAEIYFIGPGAEFVIASLRFNYRLRVKKLKI